MALKDTAMVWGDHSAEMSRIKISQMATSPVTKQHFLVTFSVQVLERSTFIRTVVQGLIRRLKADSSISTVLPGTTICQGVAKNIPGAGIKNKTS